MRGHRTGLLTVPDYNNLCQCENLEDIKLNLVRMNAQGLLGMGLMPFPLQTATDYGPYLQNEASPLYTTNIVEKCTAKLVDDWTKMRCHVSRCSVLWAPVS